MDRSPVVAWPSLSGRSGDDLQALAHERSESHVGVELCLVALCGLTLALAIVVLVSWAVPLTAIPEGFPEMNPMIACGFFVASVSLLLLRRSEDDRSSIWIGSGLAIALSAIAALKLCSLEFAWNLEIDSWLFANEVAARSTPGNHFAPKTALAFVLVGAVLLLLRNARAYRFAEILSCIVAVIGVLNLQGSAFGLQSLHDAPGFVPMSHFTGLVFTFLGVALLLARPEWGAMRIVVSNTAGGLLARRLLPLAIVLPIGLGALRLAGETAGWFDPAFGVALFATAFMAVFLAVIWWTAQLLYRFDLTRQEAERATQASDERVRGLNLELEQRVVDRTLALESATAANQELEAFSYSVSHDLRAPLRAINGFSKIVLEEHAGALNADGQRYLRLVQRSAVRMGQLVDDLLTFSRMGRQALRMQSFAMTELVRACLTELQPMQENRAVEIHLGELPDCPADPSLLKQLWLNLLSNALKYSRKSDPAVITIGSRREGAVDSYFVEDNGAGFDMKYAGKLFNVFQRLHLAEQYEGTGVGLALVQRIAQRHGGRVWAEAEVDRGAKFSFTLQGAANV